MIRHEVQQEKNTQHPATINLECLAVNRSEITMTSFVE